MIVLSLRGPFLPSLSLKSASILATSKSAMMGILLSVTVPSESRVKNLRYGRRFEGCDEASTARKRRAVDLKSDIESLEGGSVGVSWWETW